jgi:hypothetical protein
MRWRLMGEWKYSWTILNLSTRQKWVVASRLFRFTPGKSPGIQWKRGWLDYIAGLDAVEKRNISFPCRESNPAVQSVVCPYTDWATPTSPRIYVEGLRKTIKTSTKVLVCRSGLEPVTTQIWFHNVIVTPVPQVYRILRGADYRKGHEIISTQRQEVRHSKTMNNLIWQVHKLRS